MVVADSDVAVIGSVNPSEDEDGKAEVCVSAGVVCVCVCTGSEVGVCVFRWVHPLEMRLKCVCVHGSGV